MLQNSHLPTVYILDMDCPLSEQQLGRIKKYLPHERILTSERFLHKKDSDACLASFFLLVFGLRKLGIHKLPDIKKGTHGKPYFTDCDICFNISHCDKAVCCGISKHNIGVDIQDTVSKFNDIIGMTMSAGETEMIYSSPSPSEVFTRLWALKESYVKFDGSGLTDDIHTIEFLNTENEFMYDGCFFKVLPTSVYQLSACTVDDGTVFLKKNIDEYLDEFEGISNNNE